MKKFKNILLLSGGASSRFWPLENKNYFDFLGKTLLEQQITKLSSYAENIFLVLNESNAKLTSSISSLEIITQSEKNPGQAGAIMASDGRIQGEALILNINDIFNTDILNKFDKNQDLQFLAKKVTDYFPGGYLKFAGDGQVIEIIEKPAPSEVPSDTVKLVADYYKDINDIIAVLKNLDGDPDNKYERGINQLIKNNKKAAAMPYDDYWFSLKYPWHVLPLMHFFLGQLKENYMGENVEIAENAVIVPPVYFGANVKVGNFAKLVGPLYIGKNTIIADHTMVRSSHIGNNCVIGGYSEVTRSYLDQGVALHRNYVGDSVIGKNVLMGAGATTANFRFDEKSSTSVVKGEKIDTNLSKLGAIIGQNAKIGVNTTIYPGVKIGKWTYVAPATTLERDIEDQIFIKDGKLNKNLLVPENLK